MGVGRQGIFGSQPDCEEFEEEDELEELDELLLEDDKPPLEELGLEAED